jgi:lipopolysaccharide/colanic/teichoic acid biosynthesis glycosyltransferase
MEMEGMQGLFWADCREKMMGTHLNAQGRRTAAHSLATVRRPGALPFWKRTLDLVCLLLVAPALVPIMGLIALAIRLSSPGPVLFRQERIGFRGESFMFFKFRTMRDAAETRSHQQYLEKLITSDAPMEKLDLHDARVSRLGALLRASGLDELPQVFNVLRGEMSLVGPRPCIRYEYEKYRPEDCERLNAIPGLTGLWQVSGKNKTTFPEMVALDVRYAKTLSLWQDITILLRTFPVVIEQTKETWERKRARQHAKSRRPESRPATTV